MLIRYGARVTQVKGKEQRNKETEQCDIVGASGAIRCKKLRQSVRIARFGANNHSLYLPKMKYCVSGGYRFILLFRTTVLEQSCTYTYTQRAAYFHIISRPVQSDGKPSCSYARLRTCEKRLLPS